MVVSPTDSHVQTGIKFMNRKFRINCLAGAAAMAAAGISAGYAQAQTGPGGWYKVCSKQADNDFCNVQFQAVANTGQVLTSVNLATVSGKINRRIFQITVPTRRLIPAGISITIDENKPVKIPYVFCFEDRCMAEVPLDDNMVKAFKAGGKITVSSTNFQNKPNPIEVTLSGFTAAFDGPALKPDELQSRQEQLQNELKGKAEELRKKLQDEQDNTPSPTAAKACHPKVGTGFGKMTRINKEIARRGESYAWWQALGRVTQKWVPVLDKNTRQNKEIARRGEFQIPKPH